MSEAVNVRGTSDSLYEGMTKEDIYTAIEQATGGTIGDLDDGFITIWKEQNKGVGIKLWVGTTAEYNALDPKPDNVLYIKTDDTTAEDIADDIAEVNAALTSIQAAFAGLAPEDHAYSTSKYGAATTSNYGHVKLISSLTTLVSYPDGTAMRGDLAYAIGQRLGTIEQVTTDTGWLTLTIPSRGWNAGTNAPQYRKIGTHVFIRGDITAYADPPGSNAFDVPYAPSKSQNALLTTGSSLLLAPITIATSGTVSINEDMTKFTGETVHICFDYFTD